MPDTQPSIPPPAALSAPGLETLDSSILRVLMDNLPDHIYFKDLQCRFIRNNVAHARSLGAPSPEACVGKTDFDFFAREHAERAFADEQQIIRTGQPIIGKVEHITRLDGSEFWGSATKMVWKDREGQVLGTFGITRNITAIKMAEEKLMEERNLLRTIIDHLPSRIFVKDRQARFVINNQAHLRALGIHSQEEARGKTTLEFFPSERGRQAMADDYLVIEGGQSVVDQEKSDLAEGSPHWSLTTKVPLHDARGNISGLVGISHDITERKRTEQELSQRTNVMEADLHVARQIQEAFFQQVYPVFPRGVPAEASELRFAHRYLPAATLGGDFFDIIQLSDTRCAVMICDVMGHGVRAGLLTALIRGVVEESATRTDYPHQVISEINRALMPIIHQTGQPVFATAFFAVINTADATLAFANAGHPPPLVLRAGVGEPIPLTLPIPEPAAGLVEDFVYTSQTISFSPGDRWLAYTDGLFEAANEANDMFGEARLSHFLNQHRGSNITELVSEAIEEVMQFTGRRDFDDDLCMLVIESTGASCALRPALTYEI